MTGEIVKIQGLLAKVMEVRSTEICMIYPADTCLKSVLAPLARAGILYVKDVVAMHPFRCQAARLDIQKRRDAGQLMWASGPLATLAALARAMGYLVRIISYYFTSGTLLSYTLPGVADGK